MGFLKTWWPHGRPAAYWWLRLPEHIFQRAKWKLVKEMLGGIWDEIGVLGGR